MPMSMQSIGTLDLMPEHARTAFMQRYGLCANNLHGIVTCDLAQCGELSSLCQCYCRMQQQHVIAVRDQYAE